MKAYTKPTLVIDIFDDNDMILTGSGTPGAEDVKNIVTGDSNTLTLDGKSGAQLNNVIALTW